MAAYDVGELGLEGLSARHSDASRRDALHKADLCAAALNEAGRFHGTAVHGRAYGLLIARIRALLEDLDEALIRVDHLRDRSTFERAAALHSGLEELEARQPGSPLWHA